jgi:hypothetical protein
VTRPCTHIRPLALHSWGMLFWLGLWLAAAAALATDEATAAREVTEVPAILAQEIELQNETRKAASVVTEEPASPAVALQLQEATARIDGVDALRKQANDALRKAQRLAATAESLREDLHNAEEAEPVAQSRVQEASDCLKTLREELTTSDAAIDALLLTIRRSNQAVEAAARSPSRRIDQLARESDATFEKRTQAERGLAAQKQRQDQARSECRIALSKANFRVAAEFNRTQYLVSGVRRLREDLRDLVTELDITIAASHAAAAAGWMPFPAVSVPLPAGERVQTLEEALGAPTSTRAPTADASAIEALGSKEADFQTITGDLSRAEDAMTYLDVILAKGERDCRGAACQLFRGEQAAQAERVREARLRLTAARARLDAAVMSVEGLLSPLQATLQTNVGLLKRVDAALEPVLAELAHTSSTAQIIASASEAAYVEAQRSWEEAYLLAFGKAAPSLEVGGGEPRLSLEQSGGGTKLSPTPPIEPTSGADGPVIGHVYETISLFDAERPNFGAYTYVLFRSAPEQEAPNVRRRYEQLLKAIRRIPAAHLVNQGDEVRFNLFCIPGRETTSAGDAARNVVYDRELGDQLKLRSLKVFLTLQEVKDRLTATAGPFLITFPKRITDVRSTSPALFADLSGYPADAIADLVNQYMTGLLADFPRQQALWKPPKLQRVALFMMYLVAEGERVLVSPVSAANARPAPH